MCIFWSYSGNVERNSLSFIETSALDSTNVETAFQLILTGQFQQCFWHIQLITFVWAGCENCFCLLFMVAMLMLQKYARNMRSMLSTLIVNNLTWVKKRTGVANWSNGSMSSSCTLGREWSHNVLWYQCFIQLALYFHLLIIQVIVYDKIQRAVKWL